MTVVKNAIAFNERSKKELTTAMQDITNLDNPKSGQQMKELLSEMLPHLLLSHSKVSLHNPI